MFPIFWIIFPENGELSKQVKKVKSELQKELDRAKKNNPEIEQQRRIFVNAIEHRVRLIRSPIRFRLPTQNPLNPSENPFKIRFLKSRSLLSKFQNAPGVKTTRTSNIHRSFAEFETVLNYSFPQKSIFSRGSHVWTKLVFKSSHKFDRQIKVFLESAQYLNRPETY